MAPLFFFFLSLPAGRQGAKSANTEVFKDFCNVEKMEKNKSDHRNYFFIVPKENTYFSNNKTN